MAQLNIKECPGEFIRTINAWGKKQMPPLNQKQVLLKIIADWVADHREEPEDARQAEIAQLEKRLAELRRE